MSIGKKIILVSLSGIILLGSRRPVSLGEIAPASAAPQRPHLPAP
jgi:hypothetical protein